MAKRIDSYDIFRGFLLISMVLYHILANFMTPNPWPIFHWISTGFILFLGLVVGQFLLGKPQKILILAAKLLGVYVFSNSAIIIWKNVTPDSWLNWLIYGDQTLSVFEILLPMSYVLLLSMVLSILLKQWPKNISKIWLISLPLTLLLWLQFNSEYWYNWIYVGYGLAGLTLGFSLSLDSWCHKIRQQPKLVIGSALMFFFTLSLQVFFARNFYLLTVIQVVSLYFWLTPLLGKYSKSLTWLGKNSFSIYIGHILLLKLLQEVYSLFFF